MVARRRSRYARPRPFDPRKPAFAPKGGLTLEGEFHAGGEEIPGELRNKYPNVLDMAGVLTDPSQAEHATLTQPDPYYTKSGRSLEAKIGRPKRPSYADSPLTSPASLAGELQVGPRIPPKTPSQARSFLPKQLADPRVFTDEEAMLITPKVAQRLVEHFNQLRPLREYTTAAKLGLAKRGWYKGAAKAIVKLFGDEAPRFAALLAATSPREQVRWNLRKALVIWSRYTNWMARRAEAGNHDLPSASNVREWLKNFRAPGSEPGFDPSQLINNFEGHDSNIALALSAEPENFNEGRALSGPKVDSFRQNVLGNLFAATLDTWEARKNRIDQRLLEGQTRSGKKVPNAAYLAMTAKMRLAAQQLNEERFAGESNWSPAEIQETGWSLFRALAWIQGHSRRVINDWGGPGRPLFAMDALNALTHEDISNNADFAKLLTSDPVALKILRRLGLGAVGRQLREELTQTQAGLSSPLSGGVASSLSDSRDVAAAGSLARESSRHQGGFLSGKLSLSRRRRRRYAAPAVAQDVGPQTPFAPAAQPHAAIASTDEVDAGLSFAQAFQRAHSTEGKGWKKATEGVLDQLGIHPHQSHIAIGDWDGSAEHSVLNILPGPPPPDKVRLAAAWYGLLGNQRAVLIFHHDPHGPDSTYTVHLPETDANKVRQVLDHYGIKDRTIVPDKNGLKVVYTDFGRAARTNFAQFAQHYNAVVHEAIGRGELIGGSTRTAARAAYRKIIRSHEQAASAPNP